jgi:hypothetical protein
MSLDHEDHFPTEICIDGAFKKATVHCLYEIACAMPLHEFSYPLEEESRLLNVHFNAS